jgi:hypothetical protein
LQYITQYKEFAENNSINYYGLADLIFKCNESHQESLLQNHFVDESHDTCDSDCRGWYVRNSRCQCGNYKGFRWENDDRDYYDIDYLNIDSTEPNGSAEKMW